MRHTFLLLASTCTLLLFTACTYGSKPASTENLNTVPVSKALFHNPDSLAYYAELAYLHDNPKGLFVTGVAAWLRRLDENFPDSLTTVSFEEADIMLLRAAQLGYPDAIRAIHCLYADSLWHHSLPEYLEK